MDGYGAHPSPEFSARHRLSRFARKLALPHRERAILTGQLRTSRSVESLRLAETEFVTFDGFARETGKRQRPERLIELEAIPARQTTIARGGGYSYAPASFGAGAHVIDMSRFNRILEFDRVEGVARVEAGARIGDLLRFFQAHGWGLPVVPGYPAITIGGCIASDVHGKNPRRDGSFRRWVQALTLFTPTCGFETASRSENAELFAMTCGGYGLSGVIIDATLRLVRQPSAAVTTSYTRIDDFEHGIAMLKEAADADFAYTSHDPSARRAAAGRGFLVRGDFTNGQPALPSYRPMTAASRAKSPRLWNRATLAIANIALRESYALHPRRRQHTFAATFPLALTPSYHQWFGARGFIEGQYLVDWTTAASFAASTLLIARKHKATLSLLSMKPFEAQTSALALSGAGVLFAVNAVRDTAGVSFAQALYDQALEYRSQPYLTKDGATPAALARATLPHFSTFAEKLEHRRDAGHAFRSRLSASLGL